MSYIDKCDERDAHQEWFKRTKHFREVDPSPNCDNCYHSGATNLGARFPGLGCFHPKVVRKFDGRKHSLQVFEGHICDEYQSGLKHWASTRKDGVFILVQSATSEDDDAECGGEAE